MDFSIRAAGPELLDLPNIPADDIERNLYELAFINRWLGGHSITLRGFYELAKSATSISLCEIGCGGGDNLKAIESKTGAYNHPLRLTGIDINPDCILVAKKMHWKNPADFIVSDYQQVRFESKPDIIFSSLFCHHFRKEELIQMFRWMYENSGTGFFINDLQRHPLAYYSIRWLTSVFSKSYLVKNDAPLSVRRGFKKKELEDLLMQAGIRHHTIEWRWAFRWLVIVRK